MTRSTFKLPELPYDAWESTKATVHLLAQIMGKIKLAHHPKASHWWHTTLHVTPRGISTQTIPTLGRNFEVEFNVAKLELAITTSEGADERVSLAGRSIAAVYAETMSALERVGHPTTILAKPYDNPHSQIPFAEDETHKDWDHDAIRRWWQVMVFLDDTFKTFAGHSFVRTSPVHLFWHSFDFVVTRFSGNPAPSIGEGGRRSDVEAYSHEVVSFGFWPGDPKTRFPAFYSYTAPEPPKLAESPLQPEQAWWQALPESHMAMLKYEDLVAHEDPRAALLAFLESAFQAGCVRARWENPERQQTAEFWDRLDERFPRTRGRERRG